MTLNILVTGGAGYIGSIFVPELLALGHKVVVLDNMRFKQTSLNHCCANPNFSVIKNDIRNEALLSSLLKKADVIIPLAALVGAPLCNLDPISARSINLDAVRMMLKHVSKSQLILMPTTNSAYGSGNEDNYCTEESPLNPLSQYAKDKVSAEQELMDHDNAISFRLATVFGMSPRMRIDLLVNDFVYKAVYDKYLVLFESHFKRNYIHVRDVARVFLHGIGYFDKMKGEIFNVGLSNANLSKKELCQTISKYCDDFVFLEADVGKDPDQRNYMVSNAKLEATGFKPKYSLDDGIQELIKGYTMIQNSLYGNV